MFKGKLRRYSSIFRVISHIARVFERILPVGMKTSSVPGPLASGFRVETSTLHNSITCFYSN